MPRPDVSLRLIQRLWLSAFLLACIIAAVVYLDRLVPGAVAPLTLRWGYLAPLLAGQLVFWLILALTWSRLMADLTGHRLPLSSSFLQISLMNLGKYLPGKVWGMAARSGYLLRHGVQIGDSVAATYFEQGLLLHAGLLLTSLLAAALWWNRWTMALAAGAVLSLPLAAWLGNRLLALIVDAYARLTRRTIASPRHKLTRADYLQLFWRYASIWLASGVAYMSIFFVCFAVEPTTRLVGALLLANIASISLGFLAVFAPGGIGVREAVIVVILSPFMPVEQAIAYSVLSRLWSIVTDLAGGVATAILFRAAATRG